MPRSGDRCYKCALKYQVWAASLSVASFQQFQPVPVSCCGFLVAMIAILLSVVYLLSCAVAFRPTVNVGLRRFGGPCIRMEYDWKDAKKVAESKMMKSVESMQSHLSTLRVGAASPSLLDRVMVDYFGSPTPIPQIARVSASAMQLVVEPFDKAITKDIEKAILTSDLNLTPNSDGFVIRINLPPLTSERRKEFVKQAHTLGEGGKVAVRNIRRDVLEKIKAVEKAKEIGKDESKGYQDDLQKLTDTYIKKMDAILKAKEADLMKI